MNNSEVNVCHVNVERERERERESYDGVFKTH